MSRFKSILLEVFDLVLFSIALIPFLVIGRFAPDTYDLNIIGFILYGVFFIFVLLKSIRYCITKLHSKYDVKRSNYLFYILSLLLIVFGLYKKEASLIVLVVCLLAIVTYKDIKKNPKEETQPKLEDEESA